MTRTGVVKVAHKSFADPDLFLDHLLARDNCSVRSKCWLGRPAGALFSIIWAPPSQIIEKSSDRRQRAVMEFALSHVVSPERDNSSYVRDSGAESALRADIRIGQAVSQLTDATAETKLWLDLGCTFSIWL